MLRAVAPLVSCAAMLAVVACSARDPVDNMAKNVVGLPAVNESAPDPGGAPTANAVAAQPLPASTAKISARLQGHWGLSPNDCISSRGDAKGRLLARASDLKFYQSR